MEETIKNPKRHIGKYLKLMAKWMGKYGYFLIPIFIILLLESYLRTLVPLFGQHIIDVVLDGSDNPSELPIILANLLIADTVMKQLLLAAGLIVLTALIRSVFIFTRRYMTGFFSERTAYNLRNKLYKKLQDADYSFYSHAETGDLIQRCTTDVEMYKRFISEQVIEIGRLGFLVGFSIYQMSRMNINMTLISLIIAPVLFAIAIVYFRKVEKMFHVIEENEAKMTTHVQENVSGARVVKAFANEAYEVKKFDNLSRTFTDSDFELVKKMSIFWSVTDFLSFIQFFVIAIVGVIYASRTTISLGMYTAFLAYAGNIIWPMRQLGRIVGDFSKAIVSVSRLDKIISDPGEYQGEEDKVQPEIKGKVHFDHVSFKFDDGQNDQIVDIDFKVNPGETVAIIGKTGSGKSTLINLLVRLLDYQKGHIFIDDVEVKDIEKHHLRKNIGFILQEPFLFSRSVEENIKIADKSSSPERVERVARIAQVHEDIVNFEEGYRTLVGERGVTLSGGQKQRVAIARMLINPKPILVFDDSLSAVDTVTDIQIRRALKQEWKDSTVFIITHRITTAAEADKIIVIEDGKIIESGSHEELVLREGSYKRIWEIQSKIDFRLK
ncbi:ABC transporter ATP-binding protein [Hujiaoplasma nucleasis]|uniref:ABC transporter ATP-binding protein n=1 Tax=Hujiaoplasma nucleasis TaxID=2725268 RepID=A0A7L6N2M5_9MOLU|nr:ABC transporter ATP-binding protein [Hujiaoplasma nucleasis]QLY39477.1 ABC transporter ATP-binding protein [Hujiaoplasma nucleasis]